MKESSALPRGIKVIIGFHALNLVLWTVGQTGAVIDYDLVASWGLQDARALLDPVIVQVNQGIALADTLVMLPFFVVAAIGLLRGRFYGAVASWLAFGITLYWPVVYWSSQTFYRRSGTMHVPTGEVAIILPAAFMMVAAWGAWYLAKNRQLVR